MHVRTIQLDNIRGFQLLDWEPRGALAGWHVILGDNGAGKSTFLQAIALALAGPAEAAALRQDWARWIRAGEALASILVALKSQDPHDRLVGGGAPLDPDSHTGVDIRRDETGVHLKQRGDLDVDPWRTVWGGQGWFSASYGPFRRLEGGDNELQKLFSSRPRLARHLSMFSEAPTLSECIEWLKMLRFKRLERDPEGELLGPIAKFINQTGLLPRGVKLREVTSRGVVFRDPHGSKLPIESLSDGYRSVLSMTLELLRQLAATFDGKALFSQDYSVVAVPGVVLIDEIAAHLHPPWQRRIGPWFCKHFPQIQFIVASHSPLVCPAAERGSVFLLATPGTDERSRFLDGPELDRILYGDVLDAYASGVFGEGVTRSPAGHEKLQRLAQLNLKGLDEGLDDAERQEQQQLRAIFPDRASTLPEEPEPAPPSRRS